MTFGISQRDKAFEGLRLLVGARTSGVRMIATGMGLSLPLETDPVPIAHFCNTAKTWVRADGRDSPTDEEGELVTPFEQIEMPMTEGLELPELPSDSSIKGGLVLVVDLTVSNELVLMVPVHFGTELPDEFAPKAAVAEPAEEVVAAVATR